MPIVMGTFFLPLERQYSSGEANGTGSIVTWKLRPRARFSRSLFASDGVSPPSEVILSGVRANQNEGREPLRVVTMSLQRDWLKIDFAFHTALLSVAADAQ